MNNAEHAILFCDQPIVTDEGENGAPYFGEVR